MSTTTSSPERRHSDRRRICHGGTLALAAFQPEIECRLRDHSLTGARIVVDADVILPRIVDLTVPCRNRTRRAEVIWRKGPQVGLAFRDAATPRAETDRSRPEAFSVADVAGRGRLH